MGLMAKHCKKTGHSADVTLNYGVDGESSSVQKASEDEG